MKVFNALLLLLIASLASARVGYEDRELQVIQDEHIVILPFDSKPRGLLNGLIQSGRAEILTEYNNAFPKNKAFAVKCNLNALQNSLKNTDAIIEPSVVVTATEMVQDPTASWGIDRIDSRTGRDSKYTYNRDGSGVDVYIFDTGIYTGHNDFGGRATKGFSWYPDEAQEDGDGHGSHVAGTVGGALYGVAKNVNLIAVKVLDENGSGSSTGLLAGIDWIIAQQSGKTSVANLSLGFSAQYQFFDDAVNEAVAAGVVMVVAAGNSNVPACDQSPAAAVDAITVGATTTSDVRASYSNFGTCVDVFAPGSGITSVGTSGPTATRTYSGTSMAAPHVAGVAALLLEEDPSLTPAQVLTKMLDSASVDEIGSTDIGSGSPNLLVYTGAISEPALPAPTTPSPTPPAPTPPAPTPPAPTPPAPTPPAPTPPAPTPPAPTPPAPTPPAPTPPAPTPPAPTPPTCGARRSYCTAGEQCCSGNCNTRKNKCLSFDSAPTPPSPTPPAPTSPVPAPSCAAKRAVCTAGDQCCSGSCNTRKNKCR